MKIIVPMKRVADPDNVDKVRISGNGTAVNTKGLEWKPNPFDEYAVEAALRLLEDAATRQRRGEIVVVSIGPEEAAHQVLWCLAMGADRGIMVAGEDHDLDATVVARTLAKLIEKESPDLVLMGKQVVDGDSNQTAQILAGMLGWPQATFAGRIEAPSELSQATVIREVDGGCASVTVKFPAVISVDVRIVTPGGVNNNVSPQEKLNKDGPRFASLPGIMKAKKKPLERHTLKELGVDTSRRVNTIAFTPPPVRSAGIIVDSVEELVKRLKYEARVI
ncbi:MAG: electron transfer flavoprotein subunit beta/FixA family protein [Pseudomonadota bacterium]